MGFWPLTVLFWRVCDELQPGPLHLHHLNLLDWVDPKYEEEVSGCTASVGVISRDKIWVVSFCSGLLYDQGGKLRTTYQGQCRRLAICAGSEGTRKAIVI